MKEATSFDVAFWALLILANVSNDRYRGLFYFIGAIVIGAFQILHARSKP